VTFARSDLVSQTKAVTLDALGSGPPPVVNVTLTSSTAILSGTVREDDTGAASFCALASGTPGPTTTTPATTPPTTIAGEAPVSGTPVPVGEVTVTLSSGTTSYQVTSASTLSARPGAYEFDNVQPGTYTLSFTRPGGQPTSSIIALAAGTHKVYDPVLSPAAAICGHVFKFGVTPLLAVQGAEVRLFRADQYPSGVSQTMLTDARGFFEFVNVPAPQSYVVQFAFPQGAPGQFTVEIPTLGLSTQDVVCPHTDPGNPMPVDCLVNTG
jgi:hypothetical protein